MKKGWVSLFSISTLLLMSFGTMVSATEDSSGINQDSETSELVSTSQSLAETEVSSETSLESTTDQTSTTEEGSRESTVDSTVEESLTDTLTLTEIKLEPHQYGRVLHDNDPLWQVVNEEQSGTTKELVNQTLITKHYILDSQGQRYYALYTNKEQFLGYVASNAIALSDNPQGEAIAYEKYVTILNKKFVLYSDLKGTIATNGTVTYGQTYFAKERYIHVNGKEYLALFNDKQQLLGYLDRSDATEATGPQGVYQALGKYVTITSKNYGTYSNFAWKEKLANSSVINKTFLAKGVYHHANGLSYYSLYNNKGQWQGYIDSRSGLLSNDPQGRYQASGKYLTITSKSFNSWSNFDGASKLSGKQLVNHTYLAKGVYHHYSGTSYYSIYNQAGRWLGYINGKAGKLTNNLQGSYLPYDKYITITTKKYTLWGNFSWQPRHKNSNFYQQTFLAKGKYLHANGSTYYSLYNQKGNWLGYLNGRDSKAAPGPQGIWLPLDKEVLVTKGNYDVWRNFNGQKKTTTKNMRNKSYRVKGHYRHYNGSTYYSIYNKNGGWIGYLNSKAVKVKPGTAAFFNTTRAKVLKELTRHEKDRFYQGTRYRSLLDSPDAARSMSPNGAPNKYGAGMNCTGFVTVVIKRSGGNFNKAPQLSKGWAGLADGYRVRDVLLANTRYETFSSVNALLKSGQAKKGDIIYFEADRSKPNADCHLGYFWGNSPSENKFWHSSYPANKISNIKSNTPYSKIYLFKLD